MPAPDPIAAASAPSPPDRLAQRRDELMETDVQFRDASPSESVNAARFQPALSLAKLAAVVMEGYADRPALGQRVREWVTDPATGRSSLRLGMNFETLSYRKLWSSASALAAVWHHDPALKVAAGDRVCILGFAGIDYVIVDLAAIQLGAVVVPLQANAPQAQLTAVVAETEPRCLATSLEYLNAAVDALLAGHHPASLLVFDYEPQDETQRQIFEAARKRLAAAGCKTPLLIRQDLCARGAAIELAPLFVPPTGTNPLSTIYYTSGSTGSPKGAMYPESMVKSAWFAQHPAPVISLHYMPMNHSFGRSLAFQALSNGGTCYFTARSDLSALFEDIRTVRPTQMGLVPRICEMIRRLYERRLAARPNGAASVESVRRRAMAEVRQHDLGGRILLASFGSAPLTADLRGFIEDCLDLQLVDGYGATEVSGVAMNTRILRPPVIDYKLIDVPELGYFTTDKPHPRGELLVKTASVMLGYYRQPELSAAAFDEHGYYKTGDIMAEIGPDQIVYVDRRNNVLKLAQGEFVAISRLEAIYSGGHPLIRQIYLYGSSEREYLLAVLVPDLSLAGQLGGGGDPLRLKALLREALAQIASGEQLHAYEVPRDFLVETEAFSVENGLLTGVGKPQRPALKARYAQALEQLYAELAENLVQERARLRLGAAQAPVLDTVVQAVQASLGLSDLDPAHSASFKDLGGDSLSALSFSLLLEEIFDVEVPVGVITHPTNGLRQLAAFIERERGQMGQRPTFAAVHGRGAAIVHAHELTLDKFIDPETLAQVASLPLAEGEPGTVLLTGANGYLGRFLCLGWLEKLASRGGKLICIVRGENAAAARERIAQVFRSGDADLLENFERLSAGHLEVLAGDISEPQLGLSDATWQHLAANVDLIVHPAALVNHLLPYSQLFGPNVVGTAELIRLALSIRRKRFNNVSTVAVALLDDGGLLDEAADVRVTGASRSLSAAGYARGYAISKWAGEVLLREAHAQFGLPVAVFRSDMILAHRRYAGQINLPDMFTRWLYSVALTGIAPRSFYADRPGVRAHYDGLPVDFSADAMVTLGAGHASGFRSYHVLNPHDDGISMDQFVDWMEEAGCSIRRIDRYEDWLTRFEAALRALPEAQRQRSSLVLLDSMRRPLPTVAGAGISAAEFHADVRKAGVGADTDIPHLSAAFIGKCVDDLRRAGWI